MVRHDKKTRKSKTLPGKSLQKKVVPVKKTKKKSAKKTPSVVEKSDKQDDKKVKNSNLSAIIIVSVILIALVGAFLFFNLKEVDYATYNGFNFEERGKYWVTFVELDGVPYEAPFNNHPLDLTHISYDDAITEFVLGVPHANFIIAVSDHVGSTPVLAGANIARITGKLYGMPTSSALFATPDQRDPNVTMIRYVDCSDATTSTPIFWINVNDTQQRIYADKEYPNCIIIGGTNNEEILASADLFAYKILQIE